MVCALCPGFARLDGAVVEGWLFGAGAGMFLLGDSGRFVAGAGVSEDWSSDVGAAAHGF